MSGTVAGWIKPIGSKEFQGIVDKSAGGTPGYLYLSFAFHGKTNRTVFSIGNQTRQLSSYMGVNSVPQNEWSHIAATWNGTNGCNYVNGKGGCSKQDYPFYNSNNKLVIGYGLNNPGDAFNGTIDEVKIWNRALSAEEIQTLYKSYG